MGLAFGLAVWMPPFHPGIPGFNFWLYLLILFSCIPWKAAVNTPVVVSPSPTMRDVNLLSS